MPPDNIQANNLTFTNLETGQEVKLDIIPTLTMTTGQESEHEPYMDLTEPKGFTATMEVKEIGMRMINMLKGRKAFQGSVDEISATLFNFISWQWATIGESTIYDINIKQNRTHKKKRINKKWAKRYGYTCYVDYR